ncbi:hypothetical protein PG994_005006 [Apiospora phragmitis]|uniref:2EXR domain-containing protein n=1 Tax=Apiospora phragmitis TaxID=2905665 RepID=A0ABR1VTG1_9PEZI
MYLELVSPSPAIAEMPAIDKPTSFTLFTSLPPEVRLDIWRRALLLEQRTRRIDAQVEYIGGRFSILPLLTESLISPLVLVNRESREEALRRYPNALRVYRATGIETEFETAGRVHINWLHDEFYVGDIHCGRDSQRKYLWSPPLCQIRRQVLAKPLIQPLLAVY